MECLCSSELDYASRHDKSWPFMMASCSDLCVLHMVVVSDRLSSHIRCPRPVQQCMSMVDRLEIIVCLFNNEAQPQNLVVSHGKFASKKDALLLLATHNTNPLTKSQRQALALVSSFLLTHSSSTALLMTNTLAILKQLSKPTRNRTDRRAM